jgi:hypothetical protein
LTRVPAGNGLALLGFLSRTLFLLMLMELIRAKLVLAGEVPANGFDPESSNLSPFMQRLARAHADGLEGLPVLGGLMLLAVVASRSNVTDPLACVPLGARISGVQAKRPCRNQLTSPAAAGRRPR